MKTRSDHKDSHRRTESLQSIEYERESLEPFTADHRERHSDFRCSIAGYYKRSLRVIEKAGIRLHKFGSKKISKPFGLEIPYSTTLDWRSSIPETRRHDEAVKLQAGLLTSGSSYSPRLPTLRSTRHGSTNPKVGRVRSYNADKVKICVLGSGIAAVFVPGHSGGSVTDLHRFPLKPWEWGQPVVLNQVKSY